jgi:probable phosphoglycerate mutase
MRLILVRHAATEGNRHRYIGRQDLPLSAEGERQAAGLAARLAGERIDVIISSPLVRARRTAEAIAARRSLCVQLRDGLMEIDYGTLQGTIKGERPFSLRKAYLVEPMPGGESLTDVWERLGPVCDELLGALDTHRVIAVVGHFWSNRILLSRLRGHQLQQALGECRYKPANASAMAIELAAAQGSVIIRSAQWIEG